MFANTFQTIIAENDSEFADYSGMERSIGGEKRNKIYTATRILALRAVVMRISKK